MCFGKAQIIELQSSLCKLSYNLLYFSSFKIHRYPDSNVPEAALVRGQLLLTSQTHPNTHTNSHANSCTHHRTHSWSCRRSRALGFRAVLRQISKSFGIKVSLQPSRVFSQIISNHRLFFSHPLFPQFPSAFSIHVESTGSVSI